MVQSLVFISCIVFRTKTWTIGNGSLRKKKMFNVFNKNPGLNCLKIIIDVNCGMSSLRCKFEIYSYLTCFEIERSFNQYKSVMASHCNQDP